MNFSGTFTPKFKKSAIFHKIGKIFGLYKIFIALLEMLKNDEFFRKWQFAPKLKNSEFYREST
jgi:hypothetical protein